MDDIRIKLDPSEIAEIKNTIKETIREEAKQIVQETLRQNEEKSEFYSTEEAAKKLNCSVPTLRQWRKVGKIKASKIGASFMFSASAIAEALDIGMMYRRMG